jgi:tetratricopeptide (TPR) repeat protein
MATAKKKTTQPTHSINDAVKILETALMAMKKHQYPKAKDILEKLKEEYSSDLEIRGKILTMIKICEKKIASDEVPADSSSSEDPSELFNIGLYCHNNQDYKEGLKCYEKALKKAAANLDYYHYGIAATRVKMGDFPEAAEALQKAIKISVENLYKAQNDPDFAAFREEAELWKPILGIEDGNKA